MPPQSRSPPELVMNSRTLIVRSVAHYWRTHLGVVLGSALAALVLTGALLVGDSVKATLRGQAEARVGQIGLALTTGDRFIEAPTGPNDPFLHGRNTPLILTRGMVARADGTARANLAQVLGVNEHFWFWSPSKRVKTLPDDGVILNARLAAQLQVGAGGEVILRLEKAAMISKDAPLSGAEDESVVLRARVSEVVGDEDFGRFALTASQIPPSTAFVPLHVLQAKLGQVGRANVVLGFGSAREMPALSPLLSAYRAMPSLADASLEVRELPKGGGFELRSSRIFLDAPIVSAARTNEQHSREVGTGSSTLRGVDSLTYFVNELRAGDGSDPKAPATPYSMVTALDAPSSGFVQAELSDDEIQITRWLADDLGLGPGGKVTLKYYVTGDRRQLIEKSRTFTVLGPVIEMNEPQLNTSWMPDFPNVPDKDGLKKWKPGFPFEAERIRKTDEDYWKEYRGTPKAFVNLRVGQEMWGNRWGNLTSIRYPAGTKRDQIEAMKQFIDPVALGFSFIPLREQALAATKAPVDFGELFAYFSFFLIVAAAVLTGLLFTFSIEQRAAEAGLLLAVGWRVKAVRRLFLREGFLLALAGSVLGAVGAALYTKLVLRALAGVWSGATGGTEFVFAMSPITLGIGIASGVAIALIAMWLASRRLFKREAAQLLAGETSDSAVATAASNAGDGGWSLVSWSLRTIGYGWMAVVLTAPLWAARLKLNQPILFFVFGFVSLVAGIFLCRDLLGRIAQGTGAETLPELGARNTSRRRGRSLATIAVLASGVFMVVAVDSFRKGPLDDPTNRQSGTGGFALVGESSAPIYEDLNSQKGREQYALDDKLLADVHIVQMRVRDGDDASCLNLNRAVQPRLIGVSPEEMAKFQAFRFSAGPAIKGNPWMCLARTDAAKPEDPVPAIVDGNTLQWAMQKKIGDTIDYTDERGKPFQVEFRDTLLGSMLQGLVLIAEKQFIEKFPNAAGYRFFLVDCPPAKLQAVREHLSKQLGDRGLELVPAAQRLAEFNAVENTYLSIFQVLGGLGMLLGSAGLGIVVARNVLERRREFGLLEAVGFTPRQLRALVFAEHRWLIAGALVLGAFSALVAVWPQFSQKEGTLPWGQLGFLFGGMVVVGVVCAWLATRLALRGSQLGALRNE
jgi:ABC-type lipoprotein release transport system permease subunit